MARNRTQTLKPVRGCFCWTLILIHIDPLGKASGRRRKKRAVDMTVQVFIKHLACAQPCSFPRGHWSNERGMGRRGAMGWETDKSRLIPEPNPGTSSQQAVPCINLQGAFKSSLAINQNEKKKKKRYVPETFLWERTEKKSLLSCLEWEVKLTGEMGKQPQMVPKLPSKKDESN